MAINQNMKALKAFNAMTGRRPAPYPILKAIYAPVIDLVLSVDNSVSWQPDNYITLAQNVNRAAIPAGSVASLTELASAFSQYPGGVICPSALSQYQLPGYLFGVTCSGFPGDDDTWGLDMQNLLSTLRLIIKPDNGGTPFDYPLAQAFENVVNTGISNPNAEVGTSNLIVGANSSEAAIGRPRLSFAGALPWWGNVAQIGVAPSMQLSSGTITSKLTLKIQLWAAFAVGGNSSDPDTVANLKSGAFDGADCDVATAAQLVHQAPTLQAAITQRAIAQTAMRK